MFKELKDVFKLMNHKDQLQCFTREIQLFERVIQRLEQDESTPQLSDNEGGNFEMKKNDYKEILNIE